MERLSADVLTDPAYRVPAPAGGDGGLAWLRAHVVRFCEGDDHERRRELTLTEIDAVTDAPFVGDPSRSLLAALDLAAPLAEDVGLVAAAYQPHAPQSARADAAADRLVAACGGRTERAAARVCVLVQAHAACAALADRIRTGSTEPPVPVTRRIGPDGVDVEVDLTEHHFGRGAHRCPGEALGTRLAREVALSPGGAGPDRRSPSPAASPASPARRR